MGTLDLVSAGKGSSVGSWKSSKRAVVAVVITLSNSSAFRLVDELSPDSSSSSGAARSMISTSPRDTERMTLRTNEIGFPDRDSLLIASKLSPTLERKRKMGLNSMQGCSNTFRK